jgi:hypothetical protein
MTVTRFQRLMVVAITVCVANAWGQSGEKRPHIGYLYPAGGQQGSVFEVMAGGQYLRGVSKVYVSGEGVHASVLQYGKSFNNKEIQDIRKQVSQLLRTRRAAAQHKNEPDAIEAEALSLPDHPLLRNVPTMSLKELEYWVALISSGKRQPNAQLGETVIIGVTIDPGAATGDRELRLGTPAGLTNPLCFQVGPLPEICEREPNDQEASSLPPVELPVLLNGQVMPGDVDRFRFRARRGEHLVIEAQARRLIPYLADAVPGWFQATVALYDAKGNEAAFADDYRFDPDPVLFYEVPENGEYVLEIRDAIYRGREDFVYRIAVGEQPFITRMFPLGGRTGAKTVVEIAGWNLPGERLPLDTQPSADYIRQAALPPNECLSNSIPYAVDTLHECREKERNDTARRAQRIKLPQIINGCIAQPGDIDVFRFKGRARDELVAEVYARRLHSPLDSVLRLTDASGHVLEWNDDHEDKETGLLTHHADSYLRAKLPEKGVYYVYLADSQHHGGEEYAYRFRIGPPQPDFALRVTPSSINVPAGRIVPICVHAFRKDGFDGDIELVLKDAPPGFTLTGGRIPGGRDRVRMTLTAPGKPLDQPVVLHLEGRARIGGGTVSRPVVPAEDMMQAFAYQHLVPSQKLMVAVTNSKRPAPKVALANDGPLRIPAGGAVQVQVNTPQRPILQQVQLELSEPPKGVTLQEVTMVPEGLAFTLKTDSNAVKTGFADNLIVEAFIEPAGQQQSGKKAARQRQRVSLGVLPAIPFEIVQP